MRLRVSIGSWLIGENSFLNERTAPNAFSRVFCNLMTYKVPSEVGSRITEDASARTSSSDWSPSAGLLQGVSESCVQQKIGTHLAPSLDDRFSAEKEEFFGTTDHTRHLAIGLQGMKFKASHATCRRRAFNVNHTTRLEVVVRIWFLASSGVAERSMMICTCGKKGGKDATDICTCGRSIYRLGIPRPRPLNAL